MTIIKTHTHILHYFLYHSVQFCRNIQVYLYENAI